MGPLTRQGNGLSHVEPQTAGPETVYTWGSNSGLSDPMWSILLMGCPGQPYMALWSSGSSGPPWPPDLVVSHMISLSVQRLVKLAEDQASIGLLSIFVAPVTLPHSFWEASSG